MEEREIKKLIREITRMMVIEDDPEGVHVPQDELLMKFIASLTSDAGAVGKKARLISAVFNMPFERWYG